MTARRRTHSRNDLCNRNLLWPRRKDNFKVEVVYGANVWKEFVCFSNRTSGGLWLILYSTTVCHILVLRTESVRKVGTICNSRIPYQMHVVFWCAQYFCCLSVLGRFTCLRFLNCTLAGKNTWGLCPYILHLLERAKPVTSARTSPYLVSLTLMRAVVNPSFSSVNEQMTSFSHPIYSYFICGRS
jgi:hypothetical protein